LVLERSQAAKNTRTISRESVLLTHGKIVSLLGGKWTTARKQGEQIALAIEASQGFPTTS